MSLSKSSLTKSRSDIHEKGLSPTSANTRVGTPLDGRFVIVCLFGTERETGGAGEIR